MSASAYSRGVAWAESALTPLAERLVSALEDAPEPVGPRTPTRDLEAELLQGTATEVAAQRAARHSALMSGGGGGGGGSDGGSAPGIDAVAARACTPTEAHQLRTDCERLLQQREQLRARLFAEQERRERAEEELVNLGAQWLGTDTQEALKQRAEAEKRRELDAARDAIQREADQRVSKLELERTLLLQRLGEAAPSGLELKMQLRAALKAELEQERAQAREAVRTQLTQTVEERDRLADELRRTEATHRAEIEMLRASVRKASELLQEEYDKGFVRGLQQAASVYLASDADAPATATAAAAPAESDGGGGGHTEGDDSAAAAVAEAEGEAEVAEAAKVAEAAEAAEAAPQAPEVEEAAEGEVSERISGETAGGETTVPPVDEAPPQSQGALLAGLAVRTVSAA